LLFLYGESLPFHPNAVTFQAFLMDGTAVSATYYSVGGGFVVCEGAIGETRAEGDLPLPVQNAQDLLVWCRRTGLTVSELVLENEQAWRSEEETRQGVFGLFQVISDCMYRGCHTEGSLPGGLHVERRAHKLNRRLLAGRVYSDYRSWTAAIRAGGNTFPYI